MPSGIDQSSVASFHAVLRRMVAVSERPVAQVVKQAYIKFVESGRANTKRSKLKRKLVPNPLRGTDGRRAKWAIVAYAKSGAIRYLPTGNKRDKRLIIKRRGLAKQSWNWMFAGLKNEPAGPANLSGVRRGGIVSVDPKLTGTVVPSVSYANSLRYLEVANPGIHAMALTKAAARMQGMLDRNIQNKYERAWRATH